MTKHNAANERIKRQYFAYLAEALGHSEATIDAVAKAIARFEAYTRYKDFKAFHIEQAKAFKRDLSAQHGDRSGEPLSKATLYATLTALKRFFVWLAGQPGYKSRLSYADAEYFNLSAKETRIAKATRPARIPTLEQNLCRLDDRPGKTPPATQFGSRGQVDSRAKMDPALFRTMQNAQ
jgi:Phage integrase, N-terminal SAM-like domain